MQGTNPLLLVIVTVVGLWILGKFLARASAKIESFNPKKQIRGVKVGNQLHVVGLNDKSLDALKELLINKNVKDLSFFIAFYKPNFVELEECVATLRTRFSSFLGKPVSEASEIEKIAAANRVLLSDQTRRYNFAGLNRAELRQLYQLEAKNQRQINYDFITRFGGHEDFMEKFKLFNELQESSKSAQLITPESKRREEVEALVDLGLVLRGRKIELKDRLSVLSIVQLKDIALELKVNIDFKSKADALNTIANMPGSAVYLAMIYNIDDLFLVKPEEFRVKEIENEWSVYSSYSKLIVGIENDEFNSSNASMLVNGFK